MHLAQLFADWPGSATVRRFVWWLLRRLVFKGFPFANLQCDTFLHATNPPGGTLELRMDEGRKSFFCPAFINGLNWIFEVLVPGGPLQFFDEGALEAVDKAFP